MSNELERATVCPKCGAESEFARNIYNSRSIYIAELMEEIHSLKISLMQIELRFTPPKDTVSRDDSFLKKCR